jgi:hypothetical protein
MERVDGVDAAVAIGITGICSAAASLDQVEPGPLVGPPECRC